MSTTSGTPAKMENIRLHLTDRELLPLPDDAAICRAMMEGRVLQGQTVLLGTGAAPTVTLTYPVRICNVAAHGNRWQVDTGTVLLPDPRRDHLPPTPAGALTVGGLRTGYLVYNNREWCEAALRTPDGSGTAATNRSFDLLHRLDCRTTLRQVV